MAWDWLEITLGNMLNCWPEDVPLDLLDRCNNVNSLLANVGGKIISRQILAIVVEQWQREVEQWQRDNES